MKFQLFIVAVVSDSSEVRGRLSCDHYAARSESWPSCWQCLVGGVASGAAPPMTSFLNAILIDPQACLRQSLSSKQFCVYAFFVLLL